MQMGRTGVAGGVGVRRGHARNAGRGQMSWGELR